MTVVQQLEMLQGIVSIRDCDWPRRTGQEQAEKLDDAVERLVETVRLESRKGTKRQRTATKVLGDVGVFLGHYFESKKKVKEARKWFEFAVRETPQENVVALEALAALELRHSSNAERAEELLVKADKCDQPTESNHDGMEDQNEEEEEEQDEFTVAQTLARYTLALLHLSKANPEPSKADVLLSSLGFRYRLRNTIFRPDSNQSCRIRSRDEPIGFTDDLVPPPLVEALSSVFRPSGDYWRVHDYYAPGCMYFSYSYQLSKKPSSVVEQLIKDYLFPTACRFDKKLEQKAVYAEWWVHSRDSMSGHQMHWDTDELRLRSGQGLASPLVSTVLYLEPGGSEAPTLVINYRVGDGAKPRCEEKIDPRNTGWLITPKKNRFLCFDGGLLHGVVPTLGSRSSDQERLTFMVGFWDENVHRSKFDVLGQPQANMELSGADHDTIFGESGVVRPGLSSVDPSPKIYSFPLLTSVWSPIPGSADEATDGSAAGTPGKSKASEIVGKFCLESFQDLEQEVNDLVTPPFEALAALYEEVLTKHAAPRDRATTGENDTRLNLDIEFLVRGLIQRWELDLTLEDDRYLGEAAQLLLGISSALSEARQAIVNNHVSFLVDRLQGKTADEMAAAIAWNLAQDMEISMEEKQIIFDAIEALFHHKPENIPLYMLAAALCHCQPKSLSKAQVAAPILQEISSNQDQDDDCDQGDDDDDDDDDEGESETLSELALALGTLSDDFKDYQLQKTVGVPQAWQIAQTLYLKMQEAEIN